MFHFFLFDALNFRKVAQFLLIFQNADNRGLVLIYLKDKEKGCIDLSRAGELGVADSYSVIAKYCSEDEVN